MVHSRTIAIALGAGLAAAASGAVSLQFDVNGLRASAGTSAYNGLTHTGTITITRDANTVLADVLMDGVTMAFTGSMSTFTATIDLSNGVVTGGQYRVIMSDASRYIADILPSSGATASQAGQGFVIDGLTVSGVFSQLVGGTHFAGIDVSEFLGKTITGSIMLTSFTPTSGIDPNVNFEGFALIPSPGAASALALGALACLRRRR